MLLAILSIHADIAGLKNPGCVSLQSIKNQNKVGARSTMRLEQIPSHHLSQKQKNTFALMLSSNLVASEVLNHLLGHITERNHAHGLPHTQADTRHHTAVQALDAGLAVDVSESVADGHLLGPVGVFFLALHFYAHDFDGLVPGGETTTESGCEDLFGRAELNGRVFLVGDFADTGFTVLVSLMGLSLIVLCPLGEEKLTQHG
jgi:hypothetical protein